MLDLSPKFEDIVGYATDELIENKTLSYADIIHPDDRKPVETAIQEAIENEMPFEITYRAVCSTGEIKWFWERGANTKDINGKSDFLEGYVCDVTPLRQGETKQKQLEEQLVHAQRLESLGMLAGGVAHDFNNLLFVINGYSSLLLENPNTNDPIKSELKEILNAGQRAADLTRKLLIFSRKQVMETRTIDLNETIDSLHKMLTRLIGEDIEIRTVLQSNIFPIEADPTQIDQIIMNLAVNSRDAMPDGGWFSIETRNIVFDNHYVEPYFDCPSGEYVQLSISDCGVGIPPEHIKRIFDPFFTTKSSGKGTGLGLSTVFGIVKQSGGTIHVFSEPDIGTTFRMLFPKSTKIKTETDIDHEPALVLKDTISILVVEDDPNIVQVIKRVLVNYGFHVYTSENGLAALNVLQNHMVKIQVLLTDVIMPKMNGNDLAERAKRIDPEIKIIFMSGFNDDTFIRNGMLNEDIPFIQKPIEPKELVKRIYETIGVNAVS